MTSEEIGQRIEFIIEQQAQFASDIQVLREIQAADTKLFKEQYQNLSDAMVTVVGMVGKIAEARSVRTPGFGSLPEKSRNWLELRHAQMNVSTSSSMWLKNT